MTLSPGGEMAEILIEPDDIKGMYDFSIDVESMKLSSKAFDYGEYNVYSIVKKR